MPQELVIVVGGILGQMCIELAKIYKRPTREVRKKFESIFSESIKRSLKDIRSNELTSEEEK